MATKLGRPRKGPGRPRLKVEQTAKYMSLVSDWADVCEERNMWRDDFYELIWLVENANFITRLKYLIKGDF